jgi:FixJ family two-component response regulator
MSVSEVRTVSIIDDDESVREALSSLIRSVGLRAEAFASAEGFLNSGRMQDTVCLILDVRMPDVGGLELQRRLSGDGWRIPIIFVTAHGDEETRAQALEAGAVEVLLKPFSEKALLGAIHSAVGSYRGGAPTL